MYNYALLEHGLVLEFSCETWNKILVRRFRFFCSLSTQKLTNPFFSPIWNKIQTEEWDHKESSESFKLYCLFFSALHERLQVQSPNCPPIAPQLYPTLCSPSPESGLIASVQRAITIGWYQCLWVSVRMRVRVWVCVSNLPSNRPCPTVLNKRDFPDYGTVISIRSIFSLVGK